MNIAVAMAFTLTPIASTQADAATQTITLSGSTSISPLAQQLAKEYAKDIAKNYGKLAAEIASTGAMQTSAKSNPGAIGYMSLGDLDETQVKAVKFNGVVANKENVANGTYKMSRPFVLATKGEPTGATAEFINWIKTSSNAKKIISKMEFVTLSEVKIVPRQIKFNVKKNITLKKGKKKSNNHDRFCRRKCNGYR